MSDGKRSNSRKGIPNFRTLRRERAEEIAKRMGIDPFEILLNFAANKWEALGYDSRTRRVEAAGGASYEVDNIEPSHRITAAKDACNYLFPKLASVAHTDADGESIHKNFIDVVTSVLGAVKK